MARMTAKQMFEFIGYREQDEGNDVIVYVSKMYDDNAVVFDLKDKIYYAKNRYEYLEISPMLHEAIHKQCKELGWQ